MVDQESRVSYVHSLHFYEKLTDSQAACVNIDAARVSAPAGERGGISLDKTAAHARDEGGPGTGVFAPKCVSIVSRWNFRGFREFLVLLYNLSLSPLPFPLERIVGNFMTEVPLPPAGRVTVQYMVMPDTSTISFSRPAPNRRVDPWELDY